MDDGYHVGLIGRRPETLEATANGHKNALILPCDVADPIAVESAFANAIAAWGRLDTLFNNAGIGSFSTTIDEIPVQNWLDVVYCLKSIETADDLISVNAGRTTL